MTADQLDIFAALDPQPAPTDDEHQDDEQPEHLDPEEAARRAAWAAERRRMPDHAEMLAFALHRALPIAYRLAYPRPRRRHQRPEQHPRWHHRPDTPGRLVAAALDHYTHEGATHP